MEHHSTKIKAPDKVEVPIPPYDNNIVYWIPLDCIYADDDFNCRGIIDPSSLRELMRSISEKGLEQPILTQPWSKPEDAKIKFRIVAGYRRYYASKFIGEKAIRSIIRQGLNDTDARLLNLTENLHRADLNPRQEAQAIQHFVDAGWSQPQIAERIGKSRGWVQERVYVLALPDEIQDEVAAGILNLGNVRKMYGMNKDQQFEYVKAVKDSKLKLEKRETKAEAKITKNERRVRSTEDIGALQDTIRDLFGNGLTTRALGWAMGAVSDLEIHQTIQDEMTKRGKPYFIPPGLSNTKARAS